MISLQVPSVIRTPGQTSTQCTLPHQQLEGPGLELASTLGSMDASSPLSQYWKRVFHISVPLLSIMIWISMRSEPLTMSPSLGWLGQLSASRSGSCHDSWKISFGRTVGLGEGSQRWSSRTFSFNSLAWLLRWSSVICRELKRTDMLILSPLC